MSTDQHQQDEATGIGTTTAAAQHNQADGRIFPCEKCGADVVFHIGTQQLKCPYCGHQQELTVADDQELTEHDYEVELTRRLEQHADLDETDGLKEVCCDACGGVVVFEGNLASTNCPYCASPIQLEHIHEIETRIKPDGVLPFKLDQKAARQSLDRWVKSLWFAPTDFRNRGIKGEFNGVYLPFWTFDSMTFVIYRGERGETYRTTTGFGKNKRTVTKVRWYPATGQFQRFFDDVLVQACQKMSPKLVLGLEPWPLRDCLPFTREALAGYLARTYDVDLQSGYHIAKPRVDEAIRRDVIRRIGGDRQRVHNIHAEHTAITFKYLILPVWLLSYRYKDRVFHAMINAATGQVSAERPWSTWKIVLTVLTTLAVILGAWFLLMAAQG